ncbi:Exodeoxyribonuclease VII large subunit [Alkalithermobacter thermoalcaliphilus JW-YL-7 = DSM 7308]|uniref:Exodeoxyribonuclease 7 large subunit n=1 Tax=Alkalithermobacter thermoalcaliphilus JW-YL-7 = DSM 7308 TaxID=1121328 RepID=A0A150FPU3_CLOPD|nr:Exodeoxyribonuclease 7 large subunit [[Clostridium] paradoxum JW-YL-7 = DSM 7308]SHK66236.1 Exodeoxyribonuclease VII large subunit [[Clostridium] paradoxum JW-YL-7 = DSM 7308]
MKLKALSVREANNYIKKLLVNDPILYNLKIKGEISNFKIHSSKNAYFSLKDEHSKINCVMFKDVDINNLQLKDGMSIIASGYISIYEKDGSYQFYIKSVEIEGLGALYVEFNKLKERLEKEGLFDKRFKKDLPYMPKNIGVVTSATGAVIRDIINVVKRRFPKVNIKLYPVSVQGSNSIDDVVRAIEFFNKYNCVDIIILARGGGSIEELWSFNDEKVAKSIFNSQIPIISAIGHETDFTISDFVADLRAPTPSAAAEISVPSLSDVKYNLENIKYILDKILSQNISNNKLKMSSILKRLKLTCPSYMIKEKRINLDIINDTITKKIISDIGFKKDKLVLTGKNLNSLSPLAIIDRGYTIVKKEDMLVKSGQDLKVKDKINIIFKDSNVDCVVTKINLDKEVNV